MCVPRWVAGGGRDTGERGDDERCDAGGWWRDDHRWLVMTG